MYHRDIPKLPLGISRPEFVHEIFDLGTHYSHGYDTIVATVQLGDFFVNSPNHRDFLFIPFTEKEQQLWKDYQELLTTPCSQIYSTELAHVVTVIIAKYNEDEGYINTTDVLITTDNRYIIKMEWEICKLIDYHVKINNFITVISNLIGQYITTDWKYGSFFRDFSRQICLDPILLSTNPYTIIFSAIFLHRQNKLKAHFIYKENKFLDIIANIIHEYELDLDEFVKEYKKLT